MSVLPVFNPATGERIAELSADDAASVRAKYERARKAQPRWARVPLRKRLAAIAAFRERVVAGTEALARVLTREVGKPIAQSRNVGDEVLRIVSNNRQWTRNYKVKLALASNPKTPQPLAMGFVSQLHDSDMLSLMKSKDVPAVISTHARRTLTKKGKL